ncbi:MAG: sigma-E processing peptidase SpoIIGA [Clostridia bacterium]|nr:sigma-E processing peptidase SpoIIGA [Clostridia bacterium]
MVIYIDIVFLENLVINYFLLELTGFFLKVKNKFWRNIVASSVGGVFAIFSLIIAIGFFGSIIYRIILSFIIIVIAFGREKLVKKIIFFYLVSFILGGICFTVLFLNKFDGIYISNGILVSNHSFLKLFIGLFFGFCFIKIALFFIKKSFWKDKLIYKIEIGIDGKSDVFNVLVDSGNLLREPSTGKHVVIVEKMSLKTSFGVDFLDISKFGKEKRFYVIPYSSLGNDSGALVGISCDYIKVFKNDGEVVDCDSVVGIYDGKLSSSDLYCGLISSDIV